MEEKLIETLQIETEQNKRYCKYLIKGILLIYLLFILFIVIDDFFYRNFFNGVVLNILIISWCFYPIYIYYLKKKSLLLKKCFKKILIIWSIPIILPFLIVGGCILLDI